MPFDHNKFVNEIVDWVLNKNPTRGELIAVIYEVHDMLAQLNRQLSDLELGLLYTIAETEEYFENRGIDFLCGIEEEFGILDKDENYKPGTFFGEVQSSIIKGCDLITTYTDHTRKEILKPGLCSFIGAEPSLGGNEKLGEMRSETLTPLKAILAISLSELCICYDLAEYNEMTPINLHMTRVGNHAHGSLTEKSTKLPLTKEVNHISHGLVDVTYRAIAMITSPEEAEQRHLARHNVKKFEAARGKSGPIVSLVAGNPEHFELRKCGAYGEDRRFDEVTQKSVGINPLIAGIVVLCAGLKYGFDNKPSQQIYTETIYDIVQGSDKEMTGSISLALTEARWERLANDPVMSEFLSPPLLAQVVEAIKEQYSHWDVNPDTKLWTSRTARADLKSTSNIIQI